MGPNQTPEVPERVREVLEAVLEMLGRTQAAQSRKLEVFTSKVVEHSQQRGDLDLYQVLPPQISLK